MKKIGFIFVILALFSCGNESNDHIYKTKKGEYASKAGKFIVDFPSQPEYTKGNGQLGEENIEIHVFRSTLGPKKIFSIEHDDYPKDMIQNLSNEEVYAQAIENYTQKMVGSFVLQSQKPIKQHGLSGRQFIMNLNKKAKAKGHKGYIVGRLFRNENRIYIVTYIGINDKNTDSFLNSFRLIK